MTPSSAIVIVDPSLPRRYTPIVHSVLGDERHSATRFFRPNPCGIAIGRSRPLPVQWVNEAPRRCA